MLELKLSQLDKQEWEKRHIMTPGYDVKKMRERTKAKPKWIHFGAGNIFRAFPAAVLDNLLEDGIEDIGLIVAEGFDAEIIDRIYKPCDNLSLLVTLKSDGSVEKRIIASIAEALVMAKGQAEDAQRLKDIFRSPSLQVVSFTITEKGYKLCDASGMYFMEIQKDFLAGPGHADSYMGKVAALCYERYHAGGLPIALVSMDNFSHNGDKLKIAIQTFAREWEKRGLIQAGFLTYLQDEDKVSFPWTMIDKITPRPDKKVEELLISDGLTGISPIITSRHTYIAPYVNAEECQYLVIEDHFPAGRPKLERGGIHFTSRDIVDKSERMKVCTCLNPLHTALAVFGCLFSYDRIYKEMEDELLKKLVFDIGYLEGLPVVIDPEIIHPEKFLKEVLCDRITNPFMPDTPQRIATDTSQKLSVRFGETIKSYEERGMDISKLHLIPLVFAGWCRYLMGIDDMGEAFEVSPDPLHDRLIKQLGGIKLGDKGLFSEQLKPILSNKEIFGVDLYRAGLGEQVERYFAEMVSEKGAVRKTLERYVLGKREALLKEISRIGIIPVVVLEDAHKAIPTAKALRDGGINCAEVTFRTMAAEESIRRITERYPDMLVGAGTVLHTGQVDKAVKAGAKFIVTPGYNPEVVNYCVVKEIPIVPGCMDTNAIEMALSVGLDTVKFFPAEAAGGLAMLKALAGPYSNLKFIPTGGIGADNLTEYLIYDKVTACGGSWMVKPSLIREERFDEITRLTEAAVQKMLGFKLFYVEVLEKNEDTQEAGKIIRLLGGHVRALEPRQESRCGEIAIETNSVIRVAYYLWKRGVCMDMRTMEYGEGRLQSVYLKDRIGGFAVKLLQKQG
ncbi:2-dehydro-3-deoxyphosphogluconate aldolase/4-hydroxy-2-oxoglutarate aldolase [Lachnospiraceae bacterium MD308]|nr:2-dehydro-3-deoxyphosphogluconate aldolase/4-hydroxy-2-oxoglutarate aldolase [Lachnospiraceae bacterium MD308]MCI8502343.1 bifunctional 4-hydroxy-2-oxoglutarate aldolase/2-dehydro-3-deoxy-phosphogluconate aldolase [Dorea sp.]